MRHWALFCIAGVGAFLMAAADARAEGPTTPRGTFVVGGGWSGSTTYADAPRDDLEEFTADGWGLTFRAGLSERWGAAITYRSIRDDERFSSGERIEAALIGAHAIFTWLETAHTQWYAKVGIMQADFSSSLPGADTVEDDGLGPSIGTGFDWGGRRLAFFVDWDLVWVDIEMIPGRPESLVTGATLIGLVFRF